MRISDWSSDVCSSDLAFSGRRAMGRTGKVADGSGNTRPGRRQMDIFLDALAESSNVAASARAADIAANAMYRERSEEHTSELQSLMRTSYAVFCLKKQNHTQSRH